MSRPANARYSESHEWAILDGDVLTIGITDFAVEALGDIVFVDLPDVGAELNRGDNACEIESVKAVGEVFCPVSGTVESVNETLGDDPAALSGSPFKDGWLVKIKVSDAAGYEDLMDLAAYEKHLETVESG